MEVVWMKIYTFGAASDTPVELLYSLRPENRDRVFQQFIDQNPLQEVHKITDCDMAIFPQKAFDPETLQLNNNCFFAAQEARYHNKPIIIDAASDGDAPLKIPTASILRLGLYRSLKKPYETERPYWVSQKNQDYLVPLPIHKRETKPTIGFCGTVGSEGKCFKVGNALPLQVGKKILGAGKIAQKVDVRLKKGMSHKLREASLKSLEADSRISTNFDVTNQLKDYYNPNNPNQKLLEQKFAHNLENCEYNLCVRGNGNYTIRFFLTLMSGRIPVVLDTDCVFPFEEKLHLIRVPLSEIDHIGDFILKHFESVSDTELMAMQRENREAYQNYMAPHKFIPGFIESAITQQRNQALVM
jgi:hypothetical protein